MQIQIAKILSKINEYSIYNKLNLQLLTEQSISAEFQ